MWVIQCKCSDFGCLLVLSTNAFVSKLQTPYEAYTPKTLRDKVYTGEHKRPPIPEDWPQSIKLLLVRGWTGEVSNRSVMKNLEDILKKEIAALRSGDTTGLEHTRRRSTFVYRGKKPGARGSSASTGMA